MVSSSVPMLTASWSATRECGLQRRSAGRATRHLSNLPGQQPCRQVFSAAMAAPEGPPPARATQQVQARRPAGDGRMRDSSARAQAAARGQCPPDALRVAAPLLLVDGIIQEAAVLGVLHRLEHQAAEQERQRRSVGGSCTHALVARGSGTAAQPGARGGDRSAVRPRGRRRAWGWWCSRRA